MDSTTVQHVRHPEILALGDAGSTPNSKTGAAVRNQAPVLVKSLLVAINGAVPAARYSGYSSCPLTTARAKMLLAEFDYPLRPAPSHPFIDSTKERGDMWLLKR
ncbi:hypothetical protein [Arthrobacter wenxiniae]|uniref:hypothetical protein n=1 Tax=Arthrobacter wenxiniae TaxID=2713570 RepID=UPI001FEB5F8F|nr:hypothetical protein [Arthrobacter wenxiniae]